MVSGRHPLHWVFCFLLLLRGVSAALFAVDLGSANVKVSLIKPGRVPISVVHNELSKRKTPAVVAFQSETRLYGEDALALLSKTPQRVFLRTRDFLGRNASDPFLENLFGGGHTSFKPPYQYIQKDDDVTVRFDIGDDASLTSEEVLVRHSFECVTALAMTMLMVIGKLVLLLEVHYEGGSGRNGVRMCDRRPSFFWAGTEEEDSGCGQTSRRGCLGRDSFPQCRRLAVRH